MRQIFDCFPFFNEVDLLEIRLHEMDRLVSKFIIVESDETFGGEKRELVFPQVEAMFSRFKDKIIYMPVRDLSSLQVCTDRESGRIRERLLRDKLLIPLLSGLTNVQDDDVIIFSDCDEIPNAQAVNEAIVSGRLDAHGIHRLLQNSYYYNVNTKVDYGNDFASRARVGLFKNLHEECGASFYAFRMYMKNSFTCPVIANGGWHYSYFGGIEKIKTKVAAMASFLDEYKLFGDDQLAEDIMDRRDLHHRRSEMPEVFRHVIPTQEDMPIYLWNNKNRFAHFWKGGKAGETQDGN